MKSQLERRRAVSWLASVLTLGVLAACRTTARDASKREKPAEEERYKP